MAEQTTDLRATWWAKNLDEVDAEVARLSVICGVRILDPGVIERVLHGDASVCEAKNDLAFDKLRNLMMMHYKIRDRAVEVLGQAQTAELVTNIVERLRKRIGGALGQPGSG